MPGALSLLPVALALTSVPPSNPAPSRPLTCAEAEEEYDQALGELSGRPTEIRVCTSPQGEGQRVHVQTRWIAEGEDPEVIQGLLDGQAMGPAGAFQPVLQDGALRLTWPSAGPLDPVGQTTTETWRWDEQAHRFVDPQTITTSPWAEGLARMQTALDAGDFATARTEVTALGISPNGGKTFVEDALFLDFLRAATRVAHARARLLDAKGASAVVEDVLMHPPVSSPAEHPPSDRLVLCHELAATCDGAGSFNALPLSVDVANQLAASAFYLARGKHPEQAVALLHTVLGHYGATPDLQLLYADALWAADKRQDAAVAYGVYVKMAGDKAVGRASRRAGH